MSDSGMRPCWKDDLVLFVGRRVVVVVTVVVAFVGVCSTLGGGGVILLLAWILFVSLLSCHCVVNSSLLPFIKAVTVSEIKEYRFYFSLHYSSLPGDPVGQGTELN